MTSIDFSLNLALYGAVSIFLILLLVILYTELLKRILMEEIPTEEDQLETVLLTGEEVAAITAAVRFYIEMETGPMMHVEHKVPVSKWSQAGRLKGVNHRIRG